jgi:hypothetical protein
MMDCSQFRELLVDLDRPGVLAADLRERALAHAEACGDCGRLLTETESLDAELRRLASRDVAAQAPGRLEAELLWAFRQRKAAGARETTRRYAAAMGIAAMVLLAVGFWFYRRSTGAIALTPPNVANPLVAVQPEMGAGKTLLPADVARPQEHPKAASGTHAGPAEKVATSAENQLAQADNTGAFIALPDAEYPVALDDGAVVRVVMPRAALASFGLPVEAMEGEGTVRADLIVSEDGTPQAIRLVSQDESGDAAQQ